MLKKYFFKYKQLAGALSNIQFTGWLCRLVIKVLKQKTPSSVYLLGSLAYRKHGQYGYAALITNKGKRNRPDSVLILIESAEIQMNQMNWAVASREWQYIITVTGKQSPAKVYQRLARTFLHLQKLHAAELTINKGISLYPEEFSLRLEAAKIAYSLNDWSNVIERWQYIKGTLKKASPIDAWLHIARAQRLSGKAGEAEATIQEAFDTFSDNLWFRIEHAEIANANEDWPEALKRWEAILVDFKSHPKFSTTLSQLTRFNISVIKRLVSPDAYKKQIKQHAEAATKRGRQKLKIAIYTSYSAGYDGLKPHEFIDDRFDYFAYTDSKDTGMGLYNVLPLPEPEYDSARAIRYPKTHAHVLFKDYDVAIWLDTSLMIVGDIYSMIEDFLESGKPLGSTPHPVRNSLFEEFLACVDQEKDKYETLEKQLAYYQKIGFDSTKLAENGLLLFNLKHPQLAPALETWWDMIVRFSKRDQLSFAFAMDRNNIDWYPLSKQPDNVRTNPNFIITPHKTEFDVLSKLNEKLDV